MKLLRYDAGYSRRKFLADASRGVLSTGVLMPLAEAIAATGEISKAYPDELLSIEGYTKGKIKTGDYIDLGQRRAGQGPAGAGALRADPQAGPAAEDRQDHHRRHEAVALGLHRGDAQAQPAAAAFDAKGNVVDKATGGPWIGGNPFPDPKNGIELFAAQTLSWGRHDASFYAIKLTTIEADGRRTLPLLRRLVRDVADRPGEHGPDAVLERSTRTSCASRACSSSNRRPIAAPAS